jgi:hypothetical protein
MGWIRGSGDFFWSKKNLRWKSHAWASLKKWPKSIGDLLSNALKGSEDAMGNSQIKVEIWWADFLPCVQMFSLAMFRWKIHKKKLETNKNHEPAQPTALHVSAHIRHFLSIFPSKPSYLKIKAATGTSKISLLIIFSPTILLSTRLKLVQSCHLNYCLYRNHCRNGVQ